LHTVGWDWGGQAHSVTVLDEQGMKAARWTLPHTEAGITATLRRLSAYGGRSNPGAAGSQRRAGPLTGH
jgi:hypothetical protein